MSYLEILPISTPDVEHQSCSGVPKPLKCARCKRLHSFSYIRKIDPARHCHRPFYKNTKFHGSPIIHPSAAFLPESERETMIYQHCLGDLRSGTKTEIRTYFLTVPKSDIDSLRQPFEVFSQRERYKIYARHSQDSGVDALFVHGNHGSQCCVRCGRLPGTGRKMGQTQRFRIPMDTGKLYTMIRFSVPYCADEKECENKADEVSSGGKSEEDFEELRVEIGINMEVMQEIWLERAQGIRPVLKGRGVGEEEKDLFLVLMGKFKKPE
ncbi:hypothetical protein BJ508DRAFT_375915 [Ascobolus immersus RN42]|uniref:Uncharacterized protein n=1 Tax=Ascobolus immersus RN42 TaxID=1160509 RepID=A0A3N4I834_ASCIM|nr:hypothetical protein BJ508DRAFT_375915 [Ascobolus immersus RN42]